jgi:outer membrane lipoprotein-sorting protein
MRRSSGLFVRACVVAILAAGGALPIQVAFAQTAAPPVPAPRPNPNAAPPQPLNLNNAVTPAQLAQLQREALDGINKYFNSIRTMTGSFVQFGPEGQRTEGDFYLSKPGKIRFVYAAPATLEVVSNGTDVVVKDRKNQTQDLYPLSQTPLKFLLSNQLDLTQEANVTKVSVEPDLVTIVVEQKSVAGSGKLALVFDRKTYELKQWTVTDPQGYDTSVAIYGTATNVIVDNDQFKIDELQIMTREKRN